jgi:hypothetical protein
MLILRDKIKSASNQLQDAVSAVPGGRCLGTQNEVMKRAFENLGTLEVKRNSCMKGFRTTLCARFQPQPNTLVIVLAVGFQHTISGHLM